MDDLGDLTLIPETASEDRELLCSESKTSVLLIEQPGLECKGRTVVQTDSLFVSSSNIHRAVHGAVLSSTAHGAWICYCAVQV